MGELPAALADHNRRAMLLACGFPSSAGPVAFLEVYGGSGHLTDAMRQVSRARGIAEGAVLPYIDCTDAVQGIRVSLDLAKLAGVRVLWALLEEYQPYWVHAGPPCTFWTPMGRFNARRTRAQWEARRTEALHHLTLAAEIMRYQVRHARMGSLEQPPQCISWRLEVMEQLMSDLEGAGWARICFPSCAWGHTDPGNGDMYYKPQAFFSSAQDLIHLARACECDVRGLRHCRIEGCVSGGPLHGQKRTTVAGAYPADMCFAMADIVLTRFQLRQ